MAPFHPLRHSARAILAHAGAATAVFLAIGFVLLAGGPGGPLGSAEATKGAPGDAIAADPGAADVPPPLEVPAPAEPAETGSDTGADPPIDEPPPENAPPEEPLPDEEPAEEPGGDKPGGDGPAEEPSPDEVPGEEKPAPEDPTSEDPTSEDPTSEDPTSEGERRRGEAPVGDEAPADEPSGGDHETDRTGSGGKGDEESKPTGGSKDEEPDTSEPGVDPSEPGPVGRPQVTPPETGEPGADPGEPGATPGSGTPPEIGTGQGSIGEPVPPEPETSEPIPGGPREARFSAVAFLGALGPGEQLAALPEEDTADATGGGSASGGAGGTSGGTPASGQDSAGGAGSSSQGSGGEAGEAGEEPEEQNIALRMLGPFQDAAERVPDWMKAALVALAALSVLLGLGYLLSALRARRLDRQRDDLLQEVGLLQSALLPPVPDTVGALRTSVAYRPADGPGAGGDFYDVLPLAGGRVGFILGDVSGHGRGALARTAFMRYTLRAYLEAGLEPRVALQVAGRVIDDNLGGDFATVLLAVHDPETGSLTYAAAGHPSPIVVGPQPHEPVTAGSSPPIGVGVRTGLRQTTVPLVPGSVCCLFTDGLMEARTEGGILGRERLQQLLDDLGAEASARRLIESVAAESSMLSDDMAAVVVSPTTGVTAGLFRTEQLELSSRELNGPIASRFLQACGLPAREIEDAEHDARLIAERFGGVVLHVVFGNRLRVEVLPRNVESIEAASRRVTAGTAQ